MNISIFPLVSFFVLCIILFPINVMADHGAGGGGGCSGDCTPPTLGLDNAGKRFVKEGLGINDKFFSVDHFRQDIPTQIVNVGESTEIAIRVYENEGPGRFEHASLMLGTQNEVINGIQVTSHLALITWEKTFDGEISVVVDNKHSLIDNVDVTMDLVDDAFNTSNNVTELKFTFIPLEPFDTKTIIVTTWDSDRNSWTNYFYDALQIVNSENSFNVDDRIGNTTIYDPSQKVLQIPSWFKLNANLWSQNQIDDVTFVQGIKYCIE